MSLLVSATWPQYSSDFHKFWGFCSDVFSGFCSFVIWHCIETLSDTDTSGRHGDFIFRGHNVSLDILTLENNWPQYIRVWLPIGTAPYPRNLWHASLFRVTWKLDMQTNCRSHVYLQSCITCLLFERLWYFISSRLGHGSVFIKSEPS